MNAAVSSMRHRLFGSVGNSLLTVAMLAAFVMLVPPMLRWAFVDATWTAASPDACRAGGGACWAFIHEKYRLILFGRYPYAEQWRPLLALALAVTGRTGGMAATGAWVWLAARVVYVPLYAFGVPAVRTLAWCVSIVGRLMMLVRLMA